MNRIVLAALAGLVFSVGAWSAQPTASNPAPDVSLEQVMANPDWIGPPVEEPYWSVDGHSIYYRLKRKGSSIRDLYRVAGAGGASAKPSGAGLANVDGPPVFDRARDRVAFIRHGDVYVRDIASGATRQLTRSDVDKFGLQISSDGHLVSWSEGNAWQVWNAATGVVARAASVETENDPDKPDPDQMERLQQRLFSTLREIKADEMAVRARRPAGRGGPRACANPVLSG